LQKGNQGWTLEKKDGKRRKGLKPNDRRNPVNNIIHKKCSRQANIGVSLKRVGRVQKKKKESE